MSPQREKWLDPIIEEALDPSLPICDAHHHLWYNTEENYTVDDYFKDISGGHRVLRTVFVESRLMLKENAPPAMQPVGETEFVRDVTSGLKGGNDAHVGIAAGIVGFADLMLGAAVAPVLEAHIDAGRGRFRGLRYITAWDASPQFMSRRPVLPGLLMDNKFREGFAALQRYSLSFDAWLYHPQLPELIDLAREFPDITIIVNHAGGPLGIGPYAIDRKSVFLDWKKSIRELSGCRNVYMKLGGLGMRISGYHWHEAASLPHSTELAAAFEPYILWCIDRFGTGRCMFESNFPVDKLSCSFNSLWNAFKRVTAKFSEEERLALFYNTAVKVYRLNEGIDN